MAVDFECGSRIDSADRPSLSVTSINAGIQVRVVF